MGRSSGACFKIIACGGDSVDHEDLQAHQDKISNDRRGWSFRKRSPGHRVLSNTVISETASSVKKECQESTQINVQPQSDLPVADRKTVIQWKEESIELSAPPDSILTDTKAAREDDPEDDEILDECSIIAIQAAVRGFLAQRMLVKKRNIVKLQAVVRGYLVRKHAMGTLRCVQAIVKMQALVRARQARLLLEGSGDSEKQSQTTEKCKNELTVLRSRTEAKSDGKSTYISIEKLLSNRFARQLMESSPKSKSINIKCDSSKLDESWKWLERWMSASSVSDTQALESGSAIERHEKENLEHFDCKRGIIVPADISLYPENLKSGAEHHEKENLGYSDCKGHNVIPSDSFPDPVNLKFCAEHHEKKTLEDSDCKGRVPSPSDASPDPVNFKSTTGTSAEESVNDDYLISQNGANLDQVSKSISPSSHHPELQNIDKPDLSGDVTEFIPSKIKEADSNLQLEEKNLPDKNESVSEQEMHDIQKFSSELLETEPKKISRKASNPAFIAAQSKFEELSSAPMAAKVNILSSQDPEVIECSLGTGLFTSDKPPFRSQNIGPSENLVPNTSAVQICSSECETEISISSALDSPERLHLGDNDIEQEPNNLNAMVDSPRRENSTPVTQGTPDIMGIDLSHANNANLLERNESNDPAAGEFDNSLFPVDLPPLEKNPEADPSSHHLEQGFESNNLVHRSSTDSSPRSHITNTESQTTPTSQVFKRERSRDEKGETSQKNRSLAAGKKSLSNPNQDTTPRSSVEQLPKDHKAGKRRNSLGSSKSDHADLEPKDSSSSALPSYMQATESARAKAIASVSPRSSPDVQEKDIYVKKRHSLPVTNGRQGSPRIQRSLSQAQQNAKGNGIHSPQERKWRR